MNEFEVLFEALKITEHTLQKEILTHGVLGQYPKGVFVVEQDKYIKWLAIVIHGSVRVWQEEEEREILLYYVNPLETCSLSLAATFKDYKSLVHARTENNTTLIKIPVRFVKQWSFEYQSWFRFTTQSFITSYEDLLMSYKSLAFKRIGERLYDYLIYSKELSENKIHISHKALANELGTTREVISRLLKQMEEEGRLKLHFKMIELINS